VRNQDENKLWALLCEQFHDIRRRAYACGLEQNWRTLAATEPESSGLLAGWLDLMRELDRRDEGQTNWGVRYGEDDDAEGGADDDWWEGWVSPGARFECPVSQCGRTASHGLLPPRCWLFDRDMASARSDGSHGARPA
jgi:hypothetical protein